ncbi:hypothetical protein AX17_002372 [Amanita inopinata Kibby_2008]|nr:hypothetical protein AX17_002372 [Amanita inopinata Kibby_2008]
MPPISNMGTELTLGLNITTDHQQLEQWLASAICTKFHPSGTCAMPKSQGGVVDAKLKITEGAFVVANVHVVDASVFPFEFAAHASAHTCCHGPSCLLNMC